MAANRIQLQNALHKPYDRVIFAREVLSPIFGSGFTLSSNLIPAPITPNKSESIAIDKVWIYGNIRLDDSTEITCYEVLLQPKVRIEHSKVAIQQYMRKLLTAGQAALISFVTPANKNVWRFTLVAKDSILTDKGVKEKTTNAKRYTYLLGPLETCKTAAERFEELSTEREIVFQSLLNAFSVEKLSKAFFDEYTLHYQNFCDYLEESDYIESVFKISFPVHATKQEKDITSKPIRDFVKKLLGRVVFLYFVQKKGWLGASDTNYTDGPFDFIKQLFHKSGGNEAFYSNWLSVLFFDTLNKERVNDDFKMPDDKDVKVPFLNGGLFDKEDFDEHKLTFKSRLFHHPDFEDIILTDKNHNYARGFLDFLDAFNFTVYEDSPDDHTVAVDPEMLGHIFENLLEDNKDKGAFYTPKEIVHYMCQESLTEYLCTTLQIMDEVAERKAVNHLLKNKMIDDILKPEIGELERALDNVKICDPAIGSGAFPMGLLQEIFSIKELIAYETSKEWKPAETKLNIIQNSIYGVDIEKGAVDIARLRFWLSLVVDEEAPKPLPNLDYKIVVGDSLISKYDGEIVKIDWERKQSIGKADYYIKNVQRLLKEVAEKQKQYFNPNNKNKRKLQTEIRHLKIELLSNQISFNKEVFEDKNKITLDSGLGLTAKEKANNSEIEEKTKKFNRIISKLQSLKENPEEPFNHFDWKLDFPEVLNPYLVNENGGFDIVVGNPPWDVYEGKKKDEIEDLLQFEVFQKCKGGKINAYELFLAKTHELIKSEGINCQIFQNSFLADNSSRNLREFYFKNETIISIDSFPERDNHKKRVFESVKMSVCILISKKIIKDDYPFQLRFWHDKYMGSGYKTDYTVSEVFLFDPKQLILPSLRNEEKKIFRSYYSITSKYSDYFDCLEGELNMTFHKKYMTSNSNFPLIVKGAQIQRYFVTSNPSQGEIQFVDEPKYLKDYSKSPKSRHHLLPRIALQGISGANDKIRIISTLIEPNIYCANSCNYIIKVVENKDFPILSLLGIFNSKLTNWIFRKSSTNSNVNCYEVNNLRLPPNAKIGDLELIESIVSYILFVRTKSDFMLEKLLSAYLEQVVDGLVYELYFPELLKKHSREIIKYIGELPKITNTQNDRTNSNIIKKVFDRLNEKEHPVRINLFYMNSIPEIAIIEERNENN
jgi:Alw26I/Eco31I/Esp3I family type II restriction m6 adenine DNA methyltransferase